MTVPARAACLLAIALSAAACKGGCRAREQAIAGSVVGFEGQLDEETTTKRGGPPERISYRIKGVRTRLEIPGRVVIWDGVTHLQYRLDPARRVYTESPYDNSKKPDAGSAWKRAGRTDKVAGHACEVVETTPTSPSKAHAEACLADDLQMPGFGASDITGLSGARMRLVYFDASGAEDKRTEVVRVSPESIADSELEIPAGYTKVSSL
jgi:hypothetical protein